MQGRRVLLFIRVCNYVTKCYWDPPATSWPPPETQAVFRSFKKKVDFDAPNNIIHTFLIYFLVFDILTVFFWHKASRHSRGSWQNKSWSILTAIVEKSMIWKITAKNDSDVISHHSGEANASSDHHLEWIFCHRCCNVVFPYVASVPNDITKIFLIHQRHKKIFTAKKRFWCDLSPQWRGKCFLKPPFEMNFLSQTFQCGFPLLWFENAQWRKAKQMQPVWVCIL